MSELYMGLMSGTSADSIDAVLVDLQPTYPQLIASHTHPLSDSIRTKILQLYQPGQNEINQLGELDTQLGYEFALAANELLKLHHFSASSVIAIGSHGQTIRHSPTTRFPFSLQIGDPNIIAVNTRITTVADFRRKDIALGGQGAPLVPAFHQAIFSTANQNRVIVNIGGIANITVLEKNHAHPIIGYDTGPGNALLDAMAEKYLGKRHDENGAWAASGKIQPDLLENLLKDAYFHLPFPKSTGRETFHLAWLERHLHPSYTAADVQCTLTELTAITILDAIQTHVTEAEIFVCGGGVYNTFLLERLRALGSRFKIESTDVLGIDPTWIEAMAFAWLAKQTLAKKPGNIISVTGAASAAILGGVYYA